MTKAVIITALICEAKAIAEYFDIKLQKDGIFECGDNGEIAIIVCGIGKIKTHLAVGFAWSRYKPRIWINFGTAGCTTSNIAEVFVADELIYNDKRAYPDILFKNQTKCASLETLDKPKTTDAATDLLYDMEAFAFFEAACMFTTVNNIAIIKIVSDNCNVAKLSPSFIEEIIANSFTNIAQTINAVLQMPHKQDFMSTNDILTLEQTAGKMHLSHSQTLMLIEKAKSNKRRAGLNLDLFINELEAALGSNMHKKQAFNLFIAQA